MAKKRTVNIKAASNFFVMPKLSADMIKSLNTAELKALLYGASGEDCELSRMADALGISADEADAALSALEKLGLISVREEKSRAPRHSAQYDNEEIADAIDRGGSFREVVDCATNMLEKQLNRNDLNTLFSLYDYYGMSAELICGIVEYCVSIDKRSLAFIFNTAVTIQADGVTTYRELESYLKAKRAADGKAGRFRRLCGWGNRELTAKERNYTERWFGEMRLPFDVVKYAYEIAVDNTGEVALPYMAKILEKWQAKGVRTVEDAKKLDAEKPKKAEKGADAEVERLLAAASQKGYVKPKKEG